MANGIGPSTNDSTATLRADVSGSAPASFRYNNPGAQFPSAEAARFGQTGYGSLLGGQFKIARFPSPVNGAAANFDLLDRKYTGMMIGAAGTKWTGAFGFGVPGYDPNSMLTKAMLEDPSQAIPLLKAIAGRESGRGNNLTEEQWRQAHAMFKLGSADKYLASLGQTGPGVTPTGARTGAGLLKRAQEHIGEEYRLGTLVKMNDPNWKGPWDCSEFMSYLVFQEAGILYGCLDDDANPAEAKAYTGAWQKDSAKRGKRVSVAEAASTVGGIVLRFPPGAGEMGHIALCDGKGGTVEAKGRLYGVVADTVHGRTWQTGVLIPEITYDAIPGTGPGVLPLPPDIVYDVGAPGMMREIIFKIQQALVARGFDPGEIDGDYGPDTQAAVAAFQEAAGLVKDGAVGPETAEALGISLVPEDGGPIQAGNGGDGLGSNPLLSLILTLLGSTGMPTADGPGRPGQDIDYRQLLQLLLPLLLQATPAGQQIQLAELLVKLLIGKPLGSPTPTPQPSPMPTDVGSLLPLLLQLLGGRR
jgi:Putative peptidoglycan binding domain